MVRRQNVMIGGDGSSDVAKHGSHFDPGWAEKAGARQEERAEDIPKDALYRCAMQTGTDGRLRGKVESVGGHERRWAYSYDEDGRLVEARQDGQVVERYAYDHEGRRIASECRAGGDGPVHYSYDAQDRLRSMGDMRFAYDAGGRLVEKVERGLSTRYAYDASGFLSHVLFPGGQRLTYDRGAGGLLRGTMLDGQPQEEFVWRDGLRLGAWHDVPAKRSLEFHYEEGRRIPRAVTVYEGGYSYHLPLGADQVGTIKTVADDTGYLIKELQYDSFGNLLEDSNPRFHLPLGFAGGTLERHTGFVRFGWRYYMPEAGRFTAPDPARWGGGDPDLYDYCVDDPIGKVAPLGLRPKSANESDNQVADGQVKLIPHDKLYWTFRPKPEACDKCQAMKDVYFEDKPSKQVHPNCKCEIVGVEASQLPYDRNRIIVPPGVDLEANIAEARHLGKVARELIYKIDISACSDDLVPAIGNRLASIEYNIRKLLDIANYIVKSFWSGGKYDYKRLGRQYEPFGNFHYGLYCSALGVNDVGARAIAGDVQIATGTASIKFIDSWFDDPADQKNIRRGQELPIE